MDAKIMMKMIDVINMMAKGEIKKGTKLIIVTPKGKEYEYEYDIDIPIGNCFFVDDYDRRIRCWFDITVDTLQYEVRLIEQKEKRYLVKFNMRGMKENYRYLNYIESDECAHINDKRCTTIIKTHFTKSELQSIKPVREFLEDMENKYELIEVKENEGDN